MFYVYIIYSPSGDCYYKGFSENPRIRLSQHNGGESHYTSKCNDWQLIHLEKFETKREAFIREKRLKKYSKAQISDLARTVKMF